MTGVDKESFIIVHMDECFLTDTLVSTSVIVIEQAVDRSGWMMLSALVMKHTLYSVNMQDGEDTTVRTLKMSQYCVLEACQRNTQVRNFIETLKLFLSGSQ